MSGGWVSRRAGASAASPSSYGDDSVTDETLWTDPDDPTLIPYRRAKTIAERAAWDFMADYDGPTTLTTILPGAVFGPILDVGHLGTTRIIARMLDGSMRGAPRIAFEIVDLRDIADIHIRAMTAPAAAGERFLATGELVSMREMARALRAGLGPAADKAPTREPSRCRGQVRGEVPRPRIARDRPRTRATKPAPHGQGAAAPRLAAAARRRDGRRLRAESHRGECRLRTRPGPSRYRCQSVEMKYWCGSVGPGVGYHAPVLLIIDFGTLWKSLRTMP